MMSRDVTVYLYKLCNSQILNQEQKQLSGHVFHDYDQYVKKLCHSKHQCTPEYRDTKKSTTSIYSTPPKIRIKIEEIILWIEEKK